ncbi:MAG: hypothetical protein AB7N76_10850 [Planctomycetota bacterium]
MIPSRATAPLALAAVLGLGLALGTARVRGQDGAPPQPSDQQPAPSATPTASPAGSPTPAPSPRDPFRLGPRVEGAGPLAEALPPLELRGVVRVRGRKPTALLALSGATQVVTEGEQLDLLLPATPGATGAAAAPRRATFKVVAVERAGVTLELGATRFVVR